MAVCCLPIARSGEDQHKLRVVQIPVAGNGTVSGTFSGAGVFGEGTAEAVVRGESFALGPPAWGASEALACDLDARA